MGTSGAYGGTAGWQGVSDQTAEWIGSGAGAGGGSGEGAPPPESDQPAADKPSANETPGTPVPPALSALLTELGRRLASEFPNTTGGRGGRAGRSATTAAAAGGARGRSIGRTSTAGGRAVGGAYGAVTGTAGPLAEIGLSLAELAGLSKNEQARRILNAAIGPTGAIDESEIRQASAELLIWSLNQETEPAPIDLANRWVVEYVWQAWITEAGPIINQHVANGGDRLRIEQEMRAALEASVSAHGLADDRPLTTADFQGAIRNALEALGRIGGMAA